MTEVCREARVSPFQRMGDAGRRAYPLPCRRPLRRPPRRQRGVDGRCACVRRLRSDGRLQDRRDRVKGE